MRHGAFTFLVELHGDPAKLTPRAMQEIVVFGLITYAGKTRDTELLGTVDHNVVVELSRWDLPDCQPKLKAVRSA